MRGEIVNLKNTIVGSEKTEKPLQVQPLVRPTADGTVIEIKAIHVDDGAVRHVRRKKEGQSYRLPKPALVCRGVVRAKDIFRVS